ncbi:probable disease resistance RPP8-like protein 2 isoform X1 [Selaginella moellendorffii]|uniref:probable disease resistance RPP8-like protein 2 isoform X1 n=1 Tax=Selaginella moellendorffii TaxID=88036 RepID=UPI000D1CE639|nr:probable disease resistance RPP8-like protein 2 isoform X1 [Selaginella moellendorffii]XP_024517752.1 probable disease resistance RPP8-like protein 2 isoform X1 [Selaginella moellendorffii]XP_024517753.1 probable disease resistance RPP8-like protein 2 isoform X1 [Selaginella moellendorffii]XP_024517754.1 probable disease resistance RPP8-like protein 2 isoform X1 [Selaginella moellendorffii]XP_024517755.1 probable disease resistance RPP8-like protein 2 isoform X1 [Selaginella moellendorffii]|eukprot:XP_024517751.1 probable disease resistance RPP8-like protein 2 isoform X1 [Selaginella moellendorffii]
MGQPGSVISSKPHRVSGRCKSSRAMADAAVLASSVITSFIQGVKALKDASVNLDEAPSNFQNLKRLVTQLESSVTKTEKKYANKLHNDEFRARLRDLRELVQEFSTEVGKAERLTSRKGLTRVMACCWSAAVGDELLRIAYSMESQLQKWFEQQNVPVSIEEAMERYAQGLPSYLTLQPEDGYQPLRSKVQEVCDLLASSPHKVVLVHGLSGIGKSSLAHFVGASSLPTRFVDGSLKVLLGYGCSRAALGNNTKEYQKDFAEKIVHLLRTQLGYKKHDLDGISLKEAFVILEETLKEKNYLIIVDDVWEADVVIRFMKLQGNRCKYLVTTRLYAMVSSDVDRVEVTKEDVAQVGKEILRHHSQVQDLPVQELADELLHRCGHHPLTVTVIGQALEGESRHEQWLQAINDLSIYASRAPVPNKDLMDDDVSNAATVFGSLEFSLKAMEKETREFFTAFAALSWVEPIPEPCLEEMWRALGLQGTFRLAIGALLKGSLIGKHKSSYSYIIHDMVALYLAEKDLESLELLKLPDSSRELATVAPWLYRYGKERPRKMAGDALLRILGSRNEALQASVFDATINLCSLCKTYQDWSETSQSFVLLLGPGIPRLIPELGPGGKAAQSALRFIANYYTPSDWEYNLSSFIDTGILHHIRQLLKPDDDSLSSMVHVLKKLVTFISAAENAQDTLRIMPIDELVKLLDPSSKTTRNFVGSSAMDALIAMAEAGGQDVVDRMFSAGLGAMMVQHIRSDFDEFGGCGMKELNVLRERYLEGGSTIVATFRRSKLYDKMPERHAAFFDDSFSLV